MRKAAALVETALLLPLLVLLFLAGAQLCILSHARLAAHAAATAAARAAVADPQGRKLKPHRAAALAMTPFSGPTLPAGTQVILPRGLPRPFRRYASSVVKTEAEVRFRPDEAVATVTHDFELVVPAVGGLFVVPFRENWVRSKIFGAPHARIVATARVPAPWLGARGIRGGKWPRREGRGK